MIDYEKIAGNNFYAKRMGEDNIDEIIELCKGNKLYYQYCGKEWTKNQILNDLQITPPGIDIKDKYYLGFYQNDKLIAVIDLINGYPNKSSAYIGFFMMNIGFQGHGIGTSIIQNISEYLKKIGKNNIQLAIDKGNPQSKHFWNKNGFKEIREVMVDGEIVLVAEKDLI